MNKAAVLSDQEAHYKAQAERHLTNAQRILRELASERRRHMRRRSNHTNILKEVKEILHAA